jgi:exopolyphosphatase/guanosine-5'-triphosphate,3'-diphosphate pyrophosphatase
MSLRHNFAILWEKSMNSRLIIYGLFLLISSQSLWANDCHQKQAAIDIGSGSTKFFAAVVDTCKHQLLKTIYDKKIPLPFNESLERSSTKEIAAALIIEAGHKITEHVSAIKALGVTKISAIATSAFREASNGKNAAQSISIKANIPVRVITQKEEAKIGALSAMSQLGDTKKSSEQIIVWDIGGGSMQMWADYNKKIMLYTGNLASVSFKNQVIKSIKELDPKTVNSPNPLGEKALEAVSLSRNHAKINVSPFFKLQGKTARWLGIGGVLALSLQKQIAQNEQVFTREQLRKALEQRKNLTDEQIGGDYSSTDITNMALVLGHMEALGIERIETRQASLTQGWLIGQIPQ